MRTRDITWGLAFMVISWAMVFAIDTIAMNLIGPMPPWRAAVHGFVCSIAFTAALWDIRMQWLLSRAES